MADYPIPVVEGRGVLNYVIAELPLMAGRYELSSSIYDATISHKYDYLHRAFSFSIQPRSTWDKFGVLRLHGQWSLQTYQEDGGDSTRQPLLMKE